jgi:hypothetical protein
MTNELDEAIVRIEDKVDDPGFAIAHAILLLADAQNRNARALELLGNGDAYTGVVPMGAIEAFGNLIGEKMDNLTSAISDLAERE